MLTLSLILAKMKAIHEHITYMYMADIPNNKQVWVTPVFY